MEFSLREWSDRRLSIYWKRFFVAAALASISACGILQLPIQSGDVVFQDNFSHNGSGWDRYQDSTYRADYQEEGYYIHVLEPNTDAWVVPNLNFEDVQIEVDALKISGPDDNSFGVLCRYQGPRDYYFFLISSDGYAGIGINKDGRRKLLSHETLLPTTALNKGDELNHIRADCSGYNLSLFINGVPVATARAAEWPDGDVGLIAGTYELPGTEIRFDNFSIIQP